jgi:hypothetical protein
MQALVNSMTDQLGSMERVVWVEEPGGEFQLEGLTF